MPYLQCLRYITNKCTIYLALIGLLRHVFQCLNASSSSSSSYGISFYFAKVTSRDSVVGIVTRIKTVPPRNHGSIPGKGQEIFLFSKTWSGAHPTSYTVGTGSSFSGVKWPRREICCTKVGNAWLCTSTPPYPLMSYRDTRSCSLMYHRYRESTKEMDFDR